jgi:hypothetical protein
VGRTRASGRARRGAAALAPGRPTGRGTGHSDGRRRDFTRLRLGQWSGRDQERLFGDDRPVAGASDSRRPPSSTGHALRGPRR